MPSSELLNDLTSEPISRRTLAAGLWAAPVVALTAAAPAFAASEVYTASIGPKTPAEAKNDSNRTITIGGTFSTSTTFTISASSGQVNWVSPANGINYTKQGNLLLVTLTGPATFTVSASTNAKLTVANGSVVLAMEP